MPWIFCWTHASNTQQFSRMKNSFKFGLFIPILFFVLRFFEELFHRLVYYEKTCIFRWPQNYIQHSNSNAFSFPLFLALMLTSFKSNKIQNNKTKKKKKKTQQNKRHLRKHFFLCAQVHAFNMQYPIFYYVI